jgi:hypothetical protein
MQVTAVEKVLEDLGLYRPVDQSGGIKIIAVSSYTLPDLYGRKNEAHRRERPRRRQDNYRHLVRGSLRQIRSLAGSIDRRQH